MTMSSDTNLSAAARLVAEVEPAGVAWADTSGSFLFGPEGDLAQIELLARLTGAFATTTATALVEACAALGVDTVDIASPYKDELNEGLVSFLAARGIESRRLVALELETSYEIASVPDEEQVTLVRRAAGSAPVVLVPCTDFFSLALIATLEKELGRILLTANQATMWHLVRGTGGYPPGRAPSAGCLFELAP